MTAKAKNMSPDDWADRLPVPATEDELAELSKSFNDLLSRLQMAYERQRQFTGNASHQLRTPLTAVLGQIEVALRRGRSADEYRQVLSVVHGHAVRLRQIVESLLFLARNSGDAGLPNLEKIELFGWIHELLQRWHEHPRAGDIDFAAACESPCWVKAQPALLDQLVSNLLDNACKYSEPGTPIVLRLERRDGWMECTLEDSGRGIAAEDLERIFEPFYRTDPSGKESHAPSGTGLGLAVAQRIARAFGGTLRVESEAGKGSKFTLALREIANPAPKINSGSLEPVELISPAHKADTL
jgi:signal transduction histidine kinase